MKNETVKAAELDNRMNTMLIIMACSICGLVECFRPAWRPGPAAVWHSHSNPQWWHCQGQSPACVCSMHCVIPETLSSSTCLWPLDTQDIFMYDGTCNSIEWMVIVDVLLDISFLVLTVHGQSSGHWNSFRLSSCLQYCIKFCLFHGQHMVTYWYIGERVILYHMKICKSKLQITNG